MFKWGGDLLQVLGRLPLHVYLHGSHHLLRGHHDREQGIDLRHEAVGRERGREDIVAELVELGGQRGEVLLLGGAARLRELSHGTLQSARVQSEGLSPDRPSRIQDLFSPPRHQLV